MTGDTNEIKRSMVKIQEDIRERERIVRDRPAKRMIWSGWIFAGLAFAAGIAIIMWILDQPQMVHMRETINPLVLCVGVAGVLVAAAGHVLLYLRRGQDAQRADWEETAKGLNPSALGTLAAQLQTIETLLPSFRAAIELNREVMLRRLGEIEKQRQADLSRVSDIAVKRFEELHDQIEAFGARLGERIAEAGERVGGLNEHVSNRLDQLTEMVKARAKAHIEHLAALEAASVARAEEHSSGLRVLKAEIEGLKELQRDLERDLAALIISRQPDVHANGSGTVINLRQPRPDLT